MTSALSLTNVTKRYGANTSVDAISLEVPASAIVALLGLLGFVGFTDTGARLAVATVEDMISTPEQFAALLKSDMAKFAKLIKDANIRFEP